MKQGVWPGPPICARRRRWLDLNRAQNMRLLPRLTNMDHQRRDSLVHILERLLRSSMASSLSSRWGTNTITRSLRSNMREKDLGGG